MTIMRKINHGTMYLLKTPTVYMPEEYGKLGTISPQRPIRDLMKYQEILY
jgi:hypothetical protein